MKYYMSRRGRDIDTEDGQAYGVRACVGEGPCEAPSSPFSKQYGIQLIFHRISSSFVVEGHSHVDPAYSLSVWTESESCVQCFHIPS